MPLNDPIGSTALDVLKRNAQDTDRFVNQTSGTVINRTGAQITPLPVIAQQAQDLVDQTAQQLAAAVTATGWFVVGEFATGFTFTARNQIGFDASGNTWSYNGSLPFTVPAGTVPSEPTYTNRGDAALRSALAAPDSTVPIGGVEAGDLARRYHEAVSVKDFGAKGDWDDNTHTGADDTEAIQNAVNSGNAIHFPKGKYKVSLPITLPSGTLIFGDGWSKTKIFAYGCDAFKLLPNTNVGNISRMEISSYSELNVIDPKVFSGISSEGVAGQINSWMTIKDVRMRGWGICVDWRYTWNSVLDNVETGFCAQGVRLFGQSVNNSINNSRILADAGDYSVNLQSDAEIIGEGLMISNSLLASGAYGVFGNNGFLALNISNSVIDLITNTAIRVTDPRAMVISNSWL